LMVSDAKVFFKKTGGCNFPFSTLHSASYISYFTQKIIITTFVSYGLIEEIFQETDLLDRNSI